ncbi:peptide/nickel transport system permease protein [Friedmanniella endophytica]|uniref:Peptide/nickel transport system permease protein n=1 Tax=Microlunatus kandeliicorticis TaxID=1759536 RepID=A0A7W3IQU8_9ACTN|nr:ABC transporter permease [Microlunatus kandeliicorticis]MBA8793551.1 peptide/nickel transport system permease protein [Microlunatus kandeliicorticis]
MSAIAANTGAAVEPTAASTPNPSSRGRRGSGVWRAVRGNGKAMAGAVLLLVFIVMAAVPQLFTSVSDPNKRAFDLSLPPSADHILGTTAFGQDVWAQLVWGTRLSLLVAVVAGALASILSVIIGISAAYLGGIPDAVLSLLTDVFLVIPAFPLIIVIAAYAGGGSLTVLIVVLVITGWSYGARQLRAQALSLRRRDFLESARVRGERSSYIIIFEILPTMTSLIAANFLGAALYAVLTQAGLQFLGLGNPSSVSWGTMLYWAQNNEALQTGQAWWVIAPGLCIALLGAAFALLNYAFDEIGNPALRPVPRARRRRQAQEATR